MLPVLALALACSSFMPAQEVGGQSARALLEQVQDRLYRPQDDGLQSITFIVPLIETGEQLTAMMPNRGAAMPELPASLRLAEVSVAWAEGGDPIISAQVAGNLPESLSHVTQQLQAAMPRRGDQLLTALLNRKIDFTGLLSSYDATIAGTTEGETHVVLQRKPAASEALAPAPLITWTFAGDGAPQQSVIELPAQPAARMPPSTITSNYRWRRVGPRGQLLLESLSQVTDMGSAGHIDTLTTFHYVVVGGITLLSGVTESAEQERGSFRPPIMTKTTMLEDMVVNGGA